jgi:small-conductance mechanosensitive channel
MSPGELLAGLPPGVRPGGVVVRAARHGRGAPALVYRGASRLGRRAPMFLVFDGALLGRTRGPMRLLLPLLGAHAALPILRPVVPPPLLAVGDLVLHLVLIAAVAWVLIAVTSAFEDVVIRRFDVGVADNLRARRVRTQVGVLRRVLVIGIAIFALAAALSRVRGLEAVGTGLIASAGVIGIIVSIAAQRPLGNLVAGVQLALTQPIRVEDAVVVEGEWGTVEEITLTYVVVRIWDARRLVLPISHFFERPFQNWTRTSAQIIGTVFWHVDYAAPIDAIRGACEQAVRASPHWDGRVCRLDVTDAREKTIELRAIMSAANASQTWDLRCEVREAVLRFIQERHPEALPRTRLARAVEQGAHAPGAS